MTPHSVFVIDDDPATRDALLTFLRGAGLRARAFADGQDFLDHLPEDTTACVLTDVRMPHLDGVELVRRLRDLRGHRWPVIVMTGHADVPLAVQMMKAGVVDFIEKPFEPNRILDSVRGCINALASLRPEIEAREAAAARLATLTPRERQVFDALIRGRSNKEIALDLDISPRTVEVYRANAMMKLQAKTLSDLVRMVTIARLS